LFFGFGIQAADALESSTWWLQRKATDRYTNEAHGQGYVARSAFKLQQLLNKYKQIKANVIVDLGSSPGGWTQMALERFSGASVLSVDLKGAV
jgi:23S rRNA U2552 (ribose-2'-O)-methylase RlmE/FtsJ